MTGQRSVSEAGERLQSAEAGEDSLAGVGRIRKDEI